MSIIPNSMVEVAMAAAIMGFPVFPACPIRKIPKIKGWQSKASKDFAQLQHWWTVLPDAMVGVVTGRPSGRFVVDIDPDGQNPWDILAAFEAHVGAFPKEFIVRTPSGGLHIYVTMPEGTDIRNSCKTVWPCIDIRGTGGLAIFPFSKRADGRKYELVITE